MGAEGIVKGGKLVYVLEPNTHAQRIFLMSYLLRPPWATIVVASRVVPEHSRVKNSVFVSNFKMLGRRPKNDPQTKNWRKSGKRRNYWGQLVFLCPSRGGG